jgi:hypothetical protein
MTDQLSSDRAATFARYARNLTSFAERTEARAPGRMAHITGDVLKAAALCQEASDAYARGDKAAASTARSAYAEIAVRNSTVSSMVSQEG